MASVEDGERLELAVLNQDCIAYERVTDLNVFYDKLGGVRMDAPLDHFLNWYERGQTRFTEYLNLAFLAGLALLRMTKSGRDEPYVYFMPYQACTGRLSRGWPLIAMGFELGEVVAELAHYI